MVNKIIGKTERQTQDRVILQLHNEMGYDYLGYWEEEPRSSPIEENLLLSFLTEKQKLSTAIAKKAIDEFTKVASNLSNSLYEANKETYKLLRYGVTVREELGQPKQTVWLIDWNNTANNHFAFAEEVTVSGKHEKRPDIVIYVNGIALGVIELKRSKVSVAEGIRQNLDNQKSQFIEKFFTTMQFVMAQIHHPHLADHAPMPPQKWMERLDGVAKRTKRICR
jgi:type I restriction enzyme R subunit